MPSKCMCVHYSETPGIKTLKSSGGSSIGRTRRTPPPPLLVKILNFHAFFLNIVKLTALFQPKCSLRPLLLHILDPPLLKSILMQVTYFHSGPIYAISEWRRQEQVFFCTFNRRESRFEGRGVVRGGYPPPQFLILLVLTGAFS